MNPRRNKRLDALRKTEVTLLAFFAGAYPEKTNFVDDLKAFGKKFEAAGPRQDISQLVEDWKARRAKAAENAFGTSQCPHLLRFESGPYVAFVPDLMTPDELKAFQTSVMLRGLRLAEVCARKINDHWTYKLNGTN